MCLIPESDESRVRISADASFAPGGDRSRTGVVIRVAGAIVHWASNRQSGAVFSAHEAELNGAITGTKVGVSIREMVQELEEKEAKLKDFCVIICLGATEASFSSWEMMV